MKEKIPIRVQYFAVSLGLLTAGLLLFWGLRGPFSGKNYSFFVIWTCLFFLLEYRAWFFFFGPNKIAHSLHGIFLLGGAFLFGPFFAASSGVVGRGLALMLLGAPRVKVLFNLSSGVISFGMGWTVLKLFYNSGTFFSPSAFLGVAACGGAALGAIVLQFAGLFALLEHRSLKQALLRLSGKEYATYGLVMTIEISVAILFVLLFREQPLAIPLLAIPAVALHLAKNEQQEALKSSEATVTALSKILDQRDDYTKGHSDNVTIYARIIAEEMNLPEEEIARIQTAARMHDLGKIVIRDEVLRKPGKLDEVELKHMKSHVGLSEEFLSGITFFRNFGYPQVAGAHHERWDGSGYPKGLSGEGIPFGARIMAVADVFDAMTCHRAYRRAMSEQEVVAHIEREAGKQFDPQVVDIFLSAYKKGRFKQHLAYNRLWSLLQSLGYSYDLPVRAAEPIGPGTRTDEMQNVVGAPSP